LQFLRFCKRVGASGPKELHNQFNFLFILHP
jgi:hypothetical protein